MDGNSPSDKQLRGAELELMVAEYRLASIEHQILRHEKKWFEEFARPQASLEEPLIT